MTRIITISGKTTDLCYIDIEHLGIEYCGYVPNGIGLGNDGDYLNFSIDLDTGKIVDWKPISDVSIQQVIKVASGEDIDDSRE